MSGLREAMQAHAQMTSENKAEDKRAIVTAYDPNSYSVKVSLMPEDVETGWIPLGSPWVGNGWGMYCPPSIGDIGHVSFCEGSNDAGMAGMRFYNDKSRPLAVPSGEFWVVHKSGSHFKFLNDGTVEVHASADLKITGGGQSACKGVVQGDSICAFTGMPHVMISTNVKASK